MIEHLVKEGLVPFWQHVCATYSPGMIEFVASVMIQLLGFLLPATLCLFFDIWSPWFSSRYKIQAIEKQPTTLEIARCVGLAIFNHVYLMAGHFVLFYATGFKHSFLSRIVPELPPWQEVVRDFLLGVLIREVQFYYTHRLLHRPWFYRRFHRVHHEFAAPIAFAAVYSHPIDHSLQNAFPIAIPMAIVRPHFLTFAIFSTLMLVDAAVAHSGYDIWRLPSVKSHDVHHERPSVNFGVIGLMDWLHGTAWTCDAKPKDKKL